MTLNAECINLHSATQLCQTIPGLPGCIKAVGDDPTTNAPLQQYMLRSKWEMAAAFHGEKPLSVRKKKDFSFPFEVHILCFCSVLWALLMIKSLISKNRKQKICQRKDGSLTSTEFSTTVTALKTSVVGDCLQLTEETLGVIDYLSWKYNRAWRILSQVVGGQAVQVNWLDAAGAEEETLMFFFF